MEMGTPTVVILCCLLFSTAVSEDDGGRWLTPQMLLCEVTALRQDVGRSATQPHRSGNNIPMGANRWKNKIFVTVPRRTSSEGVPSTLNYVWANSTLRHNVPLIPYPNWDYNVLPKRRNDSFVSVYRTAIDSCDRLWFIDTGVTGSLGIPIEIQPTVLVIIDLNTDTILRRHIFKNDVLLPNSATVSLTVDEGASSCDDTFAYLPDLGGYGLIVYNYKADDSYRVNHNYFHLEPLHGEFFIGGYNFQWSDGVFSIALTAPYSDGTRDAFFHSMAGTHLYRVSTKILKDKRLATRSYHGNDFEVVGDRGNLSQTSMSGLHEATGILFLNLVNQNALGCWNIRSPLKDLSTVFKDDQRMVYPSDLKIRGDDIIVLSNKMPVFLNAGLNYNEINFRVWMENIYKAVEGTKCRMAGYSPADDALRYFDQLTKLQQRNDHGPFFQYFK